VVVPCILHSAEERGTHAAAEALWLARAALASPSDDSEATSFAAMTIALLGGSIETALLASQRTLNPNPGGFVAFVHSGGIQRAANHPNAAAGRFIRETLTPGDPLRSYAE
jgi:hypothetical protein